jgi:hypothetical protein
MPNGPATARLPLLLLLLPPTAAAAADTCQMDHAEERVHKYCVVHAEQCITQTEAMTRESMPLAGASGNLAKHADAA